MLANCEQNHIVINIITIVIIIIIIVVIIVAIITARFRYRYQTVAMYRRCIVRLDLVLYICVAALRRKACFLIVFVQLPIVYSRGA